MGTHPSEIRIALSKFGQHGYLLTEAIFYKMGIKPFRFILDALPCMLNRVQLETRSTSLPKPLGGRRSGLKSTGLKLDAV
jgi:hypothetical protein